MVALRITKFIAATFGLMASGAWALSAMADTFAVRAMLPWMMDPAVPKFQADMNAWAAGMTEVLRAGARRLLAQAVEMEADAFLSAM